VSVPFGNFAGLPWNPNDVDENDDDLIEWDRDERKWKCRCTVGAAGSRCRHVRWKMDQEDVPVSGEYL